MCDGHHPRGFGFVLGPRMMHDMCGCGPEPSKETKIKQLEAFKSKLEDHIKHIDETIQEIEGKSE